MLSVFCIFHVFICVSLQVDNSPPYVGAFAISTDHAIDHGRHREDWMTYETINGTTFLKLAWLGFGDPHSGISIYHVHVGRHFYSSDQGVIVEHLDDDFHKEGPVQKYKFEFTEKLMPDERIYVKVVAENKASYGPLKLDTFCSSALI